MDTIYDLIHNYVGELLKYKDTVSKLDTLEYIDKYNTINRIIDRINFINNEMNILPTKIEKEKVSLSKIMNNSLKNIR